MTLIIENVMTKVVMVNQMIYHDVSSTLVGNVKTILVIAEARTGMLDSFYRLTHVMLMAGMMMTIVNQW